MEYQNPKSGTKTKCLNLDIINTLPENIIEKILTHMPIRDALRTSILSKKWRYSWRSMPKLVFTDNMVEGPYDFGIQLLRKYKLVNAIFHVLLLHNGPTIREFNFSVGRLEMVSEFDQILSYLASGNNVKELIFIFEDYLPVSFFSLQGLERMHLENCVFDPPLTFNGFSRLRRMLFVNVEVSAKRLQQFLSNCPLLDEVIKLPTSLVHLKHMHLEVCLMEQDEISSALCMIRSSPVLEKIVFLMCDNEKLPVRQTPTNFLDLENNSDLKLIILRHWK